MPSPLKPLLAVQDIAKTFTRHTHGATAIAALEPLTFSVAHGERVVLSGPSGCGKSTVLKMIHGDYRCERGSISLFDRQWHRIDQADPVDILHLQKSVMHLSSQFLRVVPRVATFELLCRSAISAGQERQAAEAQAATLLQQLAIKPHLWGLPPATFSGGEQQRINLACGLIRRPTLLMLDEPTAALDTDSRACVLDVIEHHQASARWALLLVSHDPQVCARLGSRTIAVAPRPREH